MHRAANIIGLSLFALLGTSASLAAQDRDRGRDRGIVEVERSHSSTARGGFFAGLGLGAGNESYRFTDMEDYTEGLAKPTFNLRLGGTPSERVRVGADLFAWANDLKGPGVIDPGLQTFSTAMVTGQFYLAPKQGLYLRGGLGFASSGTEFDDGGSTYETGFATLVGAGWDIALSHNFAIGPTIDLYSGSFTQRDQPTLKERVLNIGVQVTYQGGRRR